MTCRRDMIEVCSKWIFVIITRVLVDRNSASDSFAVEVEEWACTRGWRRVRKYWEVDHDERAPVAVWTGMEKARGENEKTQLSPQPPHQHHEQNAVGKLTLGRVERLHFIRGSTACSSHHPSVCFHCAVGELESCPQSAPPLFVEVEWLHETLKYALDTILYIKQCTKCVSCCTVRFLNYGSFISVQSLLLSCLSDSRSRR